ncbi:MAG: tetratricopeptide repeat protein [Gammaproteobacteria bacterium]|nr:tetratricopeptide repeat protein [Gammaproteobacteria bacterium]
MVKPDVLTRTKKKKVLALLSQGRYEQALPLLQQLCKKNKKNASLCLELGVLYGRLNRLNESEDCFRKAIKLAPEVAGSHYNLGKLLVMQTRFEEAKKSYQQAIKLRPDWFEAFNNLGSTYQAMDLFEMAGECYLKAQEINPIYIDAKINYSGLQLLLGNKERAVSGYREILTLKPDHLTCYLNLGQALSEMGNFSAVLSCYEQGLTYFSSNTELLSRKVKVLDQLGNHEAALSVLSPLVKQTPDDPAMVIANAVVARTSAQRSEAIELLENIINQEQQSQHIAMQLHFHAGKLCDKLDRFDDAFHHYETGNRLKPYSFSEREHVKMVDKIISCFDKKTLSKAPRSTLPTQRAVFIVGMPRSGTSLLEQMLVSHPEIEGAGELSFVEKIADKLPGMLELLEGDYLDVLKALSQPVCDTVSQDYLNILSQVCPDSRYVTDKMPQNFFFLGLISLLFPQAKIIHCRRDARDTCLSGFFQDFGQRHHYSSDLRSIALYYKQYERLMTHWLQVLDVPIYDVHYEDIVHDQEIEIRKLLVYLGVGWDESCTQFFKNDRLVNTASYDQVRQPVYSHSVGRWQNYKNHLTPLLEVFQEDKIE